MTRELCNGEDASMAEDSLGMVNLETMRTVKVDFWVRSWTSLKAGNFDQLQWIGPEKLR